MKKILSFYISPHSIAFSILEIYEGGKYIFKDGTYINFSQNGIPTKENIISDIDLLINYSQRKYGEFSQIRINNYTFNDRLNAKTFEVLYAKKIKAYKKRVGHTLQIKY